MLDRFPNELEVWSKSLKFWGLLKVSILVCSGWVNQWIFITWNWNNLIGFTGVWVWAWLGRGVLGDRLWKPWTLNLIRIILLVQLDGKCEEQDLEKQVNYETVCGVRKLLLVYKSYYWARDRPKSVWPESQTVEKSSDVLVAVIWSLNCESIGNSITVGYIHHRNHHACRNKVLSEVRPHSDKRSHRCDAANAIHYNMSLSPWA